MKKTKPECKSLLSRLCIFCVILTIGVSAFADTPTLFEQLAKVKNAIYNSNYAAADSICDIIESDCWTSDNDSIQVLFNECRGQSLFFQNKYRECIPYFQLTIAGYEKLDIRDINYLEAFLALGIASQKCGNHDDAERYYRKGLLRSVLINNPKDYRNNCYLNLGNLFKEKSDSILAQECYRRIDSESPSGLMDASLSGDEWLDASELEAIHFREDGRFEDAVVIYDRLLTKFKERYGTRSDDYARLLYSKAIVVGNNLGRPKEAVPICEECIALKEFLPNNENVEGCYVRLSQYLAYLGKKDRLATVESEAMDYLDNCNDIHERKALYLRQTGNGAYWNKHFDIAISYYERYLTLGIREEGLSYLEIPNMLAVAYILSEEPNKAKTLLSKFIKENKNELDQQIGLKSQVYHNYGRSLMLTGEKNAAKKYFQQANELYKNVTGEDNPKTLQYLSECDE